MSKGGAPKGNNNAAKGKRLSAVLQKRLAERDEEESLMNVLIDKALDGDMPAIKEVFDRIDGKPKQSVDIDGQLITKEKVLTALEAATISRGLESDC